MEGNRAVRIHGLKRSHNVHNEQTKLELEDQISPQVFELRVQAPYGLHTFSRQVKIRIKHMIV